MADRLTTEREQEVVARVTEALREGPVFVTPGGLKFWPDLDAFRLLLAELAAARADLAASEAQTVRAIEDAVGPLREALTASTELLAAAIYGDPGQSALDAQIQANQRALGLTTAEGGKP